MAKSDAKRFLDHVDRDPALQAKVREMQSNVAALAKKHGYDFTLKEFHDHVRERWETADASEDDPDTCCICIPA